MFVATDIVKTHLYQSYRPKRPEITGSTFFAMVPADLAAIYQFNPLFSVGIAGQGRPLL
jgi:hypothetical protein